MVRAYQVACHQDHVYGIVVDRWDGDGFVARVAMDSVWVMWAGTCIYNYRARYIVSRRQYKSIAHQKN